MPRRRRVFQGDEADLRVREVSFPTALDVNRNTWKKGMIQEEGHSSFINRNDSHLGITAFARYSLRYPLPLRYFVVGRTSASSVTPFCEAAASHIETFSEKRHW
mmetsp:Transcript_38455/g.79922  ORF Transcript_38455/g.79922 Transcript_38455/m.79922 type:complete len:104 (+) Transcript_38455:256-567(+)